MKTTRKISKKKVGILISFFLYTYIVLYKTLFSRKYYDEPLSILWDGWIGSNAEINLLMLIPFGWLLCAICKRILKVKDHKKILTKMIFISFIFSLFIESSQFIFHLGTFQFSDLFYNTIGGTAGSILYLLFHRRKHYHEYQRVKKQNQKTK